MMRKVCTLIALALLAGCGGYRDDGRGPDGGGTIDPHAPYCGGK